jgi:hypothetical protein
MDIIEHPGLKGRLNHGDSAFDAKTHTTETGGRSTESGVRFRNRKQANAFPDRTFDLKQRLAAPHTGSQTTAPPGGFFDIHRR